MIFLDGMVPLFNAALNKRVVAKFGKQPFPKKSSKSGLSRRVDIWAECSKGLLPTVSTSGGVAASYGSGYALKVMREHMERVW